VVKPKHVYAAEIFLDGEVPLLSMIAFFMIFIAPIAQVVSHVFDRKAHSNRPLREIADAFAIVDIFLLCLLVTFIWGIGKFAQHSLSERFPDACNTLQDATGMGCFGLEVSLLGRGTFGLLLASVGSFTLMVTHTVEDLLKWSDIDARRPLESTNSQDLRTELTEIS